MDNVTPITKSQQQTCEDFLADVQDQMAELSPTAILMVVVRDESPRLVTLCSDGLSLEGALAMAEVASSQMVNQMVGDGDE